MIHSDAGRQRIFAAYQPLGKVQSIWPRALAENGAILAGTLGLLVRQCDRKRPRIKTKVSRGTGSSSMTITVGMARAVPHVHLASARGWLWLRALAVPHARPGSTREVCLPETGCVRLGQWQPAHLNSLPSPQCRLRRWTERGHRLGRHGQDSKAILWSAACSDAQWLLGLK